MVLTRQTAARIVQVIQDCYKKRALPRKGKLSMGVSLKFEVAFLLPDHYNQKLC